MMLNSGLDGRGPSDDGMQLRRLAAVQVHTRAMCVCVCVCVCVSLIVVPHIDCIEGLHA